MITKKRLIREYGTITEAARVLGVSTQAISQWKEVPLLQQYRLKYFLDKERWEKTVVRG